jgi:tRNA C32,U32 (ribose-2'-O)-methylase TrmJ
VRKTTIDGASVASIGGDLLDNASEGRPLDQRLVDARALIATDANAIRDAFAAYIHPTDFVRVIEGP